MRAFKMKWQIKLIMFELKLSKYLKTHLIIYIVLLESALKYTKLTKIMNIKKYENQNYIIEKILAKNQIDKINHYLVKWKKYNESKNIWKFIEYLEKIQQTLRSFFQCWDLLKNYQTKQKKNICINLKNQ